MKVTDIVTITELSRITSKSRPTIYKYISDFEEGKYEDIPSVVVKLFEEIISGNFSKKDIYTYCDTYFMENDELNEIFSLIKENKTKLDLKKLKEFILEEVK